MTWVSQPQSNAGSQARPGPATAPRSYATNRRRYAGAVLASLAGSSSGRPIPEIHFVLQQALKPCGVRLSPTAGASPRPTSTPDAQSPGSPGRLASSPRPVPRALTSPGPCVGGHAGGQGAASILVADPPCRGRAMRFPGFGGAAMMLPCAGTTAAGPDSVGSDQVCEARVRRVGRARSGSPRPSLGLPYVGPRSGERHDARASSRHRRSAASRNRCDRPCFPTSLSTVLRTVSTRFGTSLSSKIFVGRLGFCALRPTPQLAF